MVSLQVAYKSSLQVATSPLQVPQVLLKEAPASKAGLQATDIIIDLAGRNVENIYDHTYAIEALKVGQEVEIVVERKGETLRLKVTPLSRQ